MSFSYSISLCACILLLYTTFLFEYLDGQNCINNSNIDRRGDEVTPDSIQIIMPSLNFSCSGRISGVAASMSALSPSGSLPVFQVWHPLSPGSSAYSIVGQVQFENETRVSDYFISNVSLTSLRSSQIAFQSGDVIGYYQPSNALYGIWWIRDISDTVYFRFVSNTDIVINMSSVNYMIETGRPLISVMIGEYSQLYIIAIQ